MTKEIIEKIYNLLLALEGEIGVASEDIPLYNHKERAIESFKSLNERAINSLKSLSEAKDTLMKLRILIQEEKKFDEIEDRYFVHIEFNLNESKSSRFCGIINLSKSDIEIIEVTDIMEGLNEKYKDKDFTPDNATIISFNKL